MRPLLAVPLAFVVVGCVASPDEDDAPTGAGKADDSSAVCPVPGGLEQLVDAIRGAGSCRAAADLASACAYESSADGRLVGAATDVCDVGFAAMPTDDRAIYKSLTTRCIEQYAGRVGTASSSAFCALDVTALFAILYPPPSASAPSVPFEPQCAGSDIDTVDLTIDSAPSCSAAADVARACATGTSLDVHYVARALERCRVPTISSADHSTRILLRDACEDLEVDPPKIAFCELAVAEVFDGLYAPL